VCQVRGVASAKPTRSVLAQPLSDLAQLEGGSIQHEPELRRAADWLRTGTLNAKADCHVRDFRRPRFYRTGGVMPSPYQPIEIGETTFEAFELLEIGKELTRAEAFRKSGRVVTDIIHPSHKLPPDYPMENITSGSRSRMADYSDVMTVRQLVDLVAFLHSRYEH
jgi:hypothetical protein